MAKTKKAPAAAGKPIDGELIVFMQPALNVTGMNERFAAPSEDTPVDVVNQILKKHKATVVPVFGPESRIADNELARSVTEETGVEMASCYVVDTPGNKEQIAKELLKSNAVEAAYVKPFAEPPVMPDEGLQNEAPNPQDFTPPATPDYISRQIYLNAAPAGIDAHYAHAHPGGKGDGIKIIDIEGAWRFTHEDLTQNQGGVIGGTQSTDIRWRNHGTAVVGEFGGDENGQGIIGICPKANVRAISIFGNIGGSAGAIRKAADSLGAGDIILIELHRPGPRHNYEGRDDQLGYIAVEFWPDDFAAIRYAVNKGVIVVEAAGNGAENLDDALYNTRPAGFPSTWTNPFRMTNPQSGAIVVGAGAPPPGTHGRNHGTDRSRLDFSNYGARVDVQGWGREVTTCGYGDLQGGPNEDFWYTDTFSGTSSASPIVVGALGCIQGRLKNRSRALLTPATATNLLRTTGSPQQGTTGRPASQRIGNRPDLKEAFSSLSVGKALIKETKEVRKELRKESAKEFIKERKDTKEKEIRKEMIKEFKEKEIKEFKEIEKHVFEHKPLENQFDQGIRPTDAEGADLEARVQQLEQTVQLLQHFISGEDRPDLVSNLPEF